MQVQVQKWGNSLAIRIPKSFAVETQINNGSFIDLTIFEGKLVATPIKKKNYSLVELMSTVTKNNIHQETITGDPVGMEIW